MAAKSEVATWQEVARQLKNPRERQTLLNILDSDDVNRIRIRGVFQKRRDRLSKRMSKGTSLQDDSSENKVVETSRPAWRSNPSIPTSDADQLADSKDAPLKDNAVSRHRKSVEINKSKMAFDEKNDAGSLLPSLDDGIRSAKSGTDGDTISNSSHQNNEKLPSIDENQLVAGNKKPQKEKPRINSSDSTNMENRNSPDHSKRNENKGPSSDKNSDKDEEKEEKSRMNSSDSTDMENRNSPNHRKRNSSNKTSSLGNSSNIDKDEEGEEKKEKSRINSSDSTNMENRNSPDHRKRNENSSNKISSPGASSNSDKDGEKRTNPKEDSQNSEIKRLKGKKTTEAPHVGKQKKDNHTEQEEETTQPEERGTEIREFPKKEPKRKPLGKKAFCGFADEELVAKLERVVNRNLRSLQGMKPDDGDDEEDDELEQKTINRFINGDRHKEIDKFLNS